MGMGFLIEKSFQHGGDYLRAQGIHVESLAIIESLDHCEIKIKSNFSWRNCISESGIQFFHLLFFIF